MICRHFFRFLCLIRPYKAFLWKLWNESWKKWRLGWSARQQVEDLETLYANFSIYKAKSMGKMGFLKLILQERASIYGKFGEIWPERVHVTKFSTFGSCAMFRQWKDITQLWKKWRKTIGWGPGFSKFSIVCNLNPVYRNNTWKIWSILSVFSIYQGFKSGKYGDNPWQEHLYSLELRLWDDKWKVWNYLSKSSTVEEFSNFSISEVNHGRYLNTVFSEWVCQVQ